MLISYVTQWLSLAQLKELLRTGEVELPANDGTAVKLYLNYGDRVSGNELAQERE